MMAQSTTPKKSPLRIITPALSPRLSRPFVIRCSHVGQMHDAIVIRCRWPFQALRAVRHLLRTAEWSDAAFLTNLAPRLLAWHVDRLIRKGTGLVCRNGPKGASHKRAPSPSEYA